MTSISTNSPNLFSGIKFREPKTSTYNGCKHLANVRVVINGCLMLTDIALLENDSGQINMVYPKRTNRRLATYKIFRLNKPGLSKRLFSEILQAYPSNTQVEPVPTFPAFEISFKEPPARPGEKIVPVYVVILYMDGLVVRDIRVIRNLDGTLRVSWPARRISKGSIREIVQPLTPEARTYFDTAILERVKAHKPN